LARAVGGEETSAQGAKKVKPRYIELSSTEGICYLRIDRLKPLSEVDVVVFDCDGVLIDVRNSYSGAAAETASTLLEALTGTGVNPSIFEEDVFFAFKKTGQFNNDWAVTYAYVLGALSTLTDPELSALNTLAAKVKEGSPSERLNQLRRIRTPSCLHPEHIKEKLIRLAETMGKGGIDNLEALLLTRIGVNLKKLLRFRDPVGESIVSTLFEEIFGGVKLFKETFGLPPQFTEKQTGYIEKDKTILKTTTLKRLEVLLKGRRFGVASGSLRNSAKHVLGSTLDAFPRDAQVWHEDVDAASTDARNLHKPNGYPLIRAAQAHAPYRRVLYVGDTIADMLTTRNADKESPKFIFLGVYNATAQPETTREMFLSEGVDAVAPSVNQIPLILRHARAPHFS